MLEWLKLKMLIIPCAQEVAGQLEFSRIASGSAQQYGHFVFVFCFYYYLFIYLAVPGLIAASRLLSWGTRTLSCGMRVGSSSLTRDRTRAPCIGSVES